MAQLKALNDQIKQQNEATGIDSNQWAIKFATLAAQFDQARPYWQRLLLTPTGQPMDEEANTKLNEINSLLSGIYSKHHYPDYWRMSPLTIGEIFVAQEEAKKRAA